MASKPLDDPARLESQRAYLWRRTIDMPTAAFSSDRLPTAGVAAIHRGY